MTENLFPLSSYLKLQHVADNIIFNYNVVTFEALEILLYGKCNDNMIHSTTVETLAHYDVYKDFHCQLWRREQSCDKIKTSLKLSRTTS